MANIIQRRRGTTNQHATFTGSEGEITIDLDKETVVCHDGSTAGGFPLAREDLSNVTNKVGIQQLNFSDGSNGQFLQTDGSGTLSFATVDATTAVVGGDLSGTVGNAQIVANAVGTTELAANSVTSAKIAPANVGVLQLGNNAVSTAKIYDLNITTAKIADAAVTDAKLATNSVTTIKITDANVTADKLATDSVTTVKIGATQVTDAKIASLSASKLTGNLPSLNGANLTSLNATNISSGTLNTARLPATCEITTLDLGNWTVTESGGVLFFATGGTNKMKLDASGNLTTVGNVIAYGSM